jgi:pimeloyl-ACP methyl ester carboxylesterase
VALQNLASSSQVDRPKGIILFLHGFASAADTWGEMLALLADDPRITARYDFATYSYTTKLLELNPLARIPELKELGQYLASEIDSPKYRGRPLTLVGHSQGGLIIQSYFAALVDDGAAEKLRNVRQAIFFATPSEGSTIASILRSLFFTLVRNPQERTLRVLNSDVAAIRAKVRQRIVDASTDSEKEWRVPIHAFYGLRDKVVLSPSATSVVTSFKPLDGTHLNIHKPRNNQDRRYTEFVEVLLDPGGHTRRFEIERYRNVLRVDPKTHETSLTSGQDPRTTEFDNKAQLTRSVKFASSNRDDKPFRIMFDVRQGAYLRGRTSHTNEVAAEERGRAEDTGAFYEFRFHPNSDVEYTVWLDIYNGFGDGRRNIHFHVDSYDSHMRSLIYELDLSPYLAAGYRILADPQCRYAPEKAATCEFCADIRMRDPLPISARPGDGIYVWEFSEIEGGVVDIVWELTGTAA